MIRERWKSGSGGFTTDEGLSYSIVGAGTRALGEGEIEKLASRITGAVNAADFDWPKHTAWLSEFSAAKNALKRYDAALTEFANRTRRAMAHMESTGAVLGEAVAHVGMGAAAEDVRGSRAELDTSVRALLAKLGEEIRP